MPAEVILRLRWFRFNPKKRMSHSAALPFSDTWTFTAISCGKKDHVSTGQSVGPGEWNSASSSSSLRYLVRLLLHSPLLFYVPLPVDDGVSVLPPQPDVLYDTVEVRSGSLFYHSSPTCCTIRSLTSPAVLEDTAAAMLRHVRRVASVTRQCGAVRCCAVHRYY